MEWKRAIAGLGSAAFGAAAVLGLTQCSFGDPFGTERDCGAGYINVGDNQCSSESVPPGDPGGYVPPTSDASADSAPLNDAAVDASDATDEVDAPAPSSDASNDGAARTDATHDDGGADAPADASADGS